jgi:hypothetical protein
MLKLLFSLSTNINVSYGRMVIVDSINGASPEDHFIFS